MTAMQTRNGFEVEHELPTRRELLGLFFEYKRSVLAVLCTTIAVSAFLVYYLLSPSYEAKAKIIINNSQLMQPLADSAPQSDFEKVIDFNTQKDVMASATLAAAVVKQLNLKETRTIGRIERLSMWVGDIKRTLGKSLNIESWAKPHDPEAAAIAAVLDNLMVETAPESKVLKLSYRAKNAQESADTLNALVNEFQNFYNQTIRAQANGIIDYLQNQLNDVTTRLEHSEKELEHFRKNDRAVLSEREGRVQSIVGITDSTGAQDEIKIYILKMEDELRQLSSLFAASDPRIVGLKAKLQSYVALINAIPERELELHRLKRQFELDQESYLYMKKNLEKATLIAEGQTDQMRLVTVLERAEANEDPVSPKRKLTMILSVFLGTGLGLMLVLVLAYFDHSIGSVKDVSTHLGLRTIGSLRKI